MLEYLIPEQQIPEYARLYKKNLYWPIEVDPEFLDELKLESGWVQESSNNKGR